MNVLSDSDVRAALSWDAVLSSLETAFQNPDRYFSPERVVIPAPEAGSYLTMPCADAEGWFGVKQVGVVPTNANRDLPTVQAHYTLMNPTGTPVLSAAATVLTRIRTAGASALAARYLAPENAKTLLIIGTGSLAPYMAQAHAQVRAYERILVWGRDESKAAQTVKEVREEVTDVEVSEASNLEEVLSRADTVSAATTSSQPLVRAEFLRDRQQGGGQHIDLVGAFVPEMRESDSETVRGAEVFVDDVEAAKIEAGDLIQAAQEGWSFEEVKGDLSSLVLGRTKRSNEEVTTLFKSVGVALEDLAVAKLLVA